MGGRIAALALGRRSSWVVIAAWVAAGRRARAAAAEAADDRLRRERDVLHARGGLDAGRPPARHALPRGRRRDRGDRVRADRGLDLHAHAGDRADTQAICASETLPALKGVGEPGRPGLRRARARARRRRRRRRRSPATTRRAWCCSRSSTAATTPSRSPKDVATIRALLPGPDGHPLRSYVTGEAGFDADRSAAVEGLDGTLLAITGALVLILMLRDLPLAADRGADARRRGGRVPDRDRAGLRPRAGRRDDGQRPVDGDPDRADVRRGHRLLPADRLALPRRAAARQRRRDGDDPRGGAHRPGDLRVGRDRRRRDARARARRLQRDARDGPAAGARDRRDDGLRADAAARAAGRVRAARVLAGGPARGAGRADVAVDADRRARPAPARPAGVAVAPRLLVARRARQPRRAAATWTSPSSTATSPSPSRAEPDPRALRPARARRAARRRDGVRRRARGQGRARAGAGRRGLEHRLRRRRR